MYTTKLSGSNLINSARESDPSAVTEIDDGVSWVVRETVTFGGLGLEI